MSIDFPKHPFLLSVSETADALGTDIEEGLLSAKVTELQQQFPKNELEEGGRISWYTLLAKQIFNAMILVSGPSPGSSLFSTTRRWRRLTPSCA